MFDIDKWTTDQGPVSEKSWELFGPKKLFRVCIQDQGSNNFENDIIKLSVNEAKLTGLWARNCATIQQILILNLPSGPKSFWAFRETGPCSFWFKTEIGLLGF